MNDCAPSTVALSVYNAMAAMDKACTRAEIKEFLAVHWGLVEDDDLEGAIAGLLERGHVRLEGERVTPIYPDPSVRRTKMIMVRARSQDGWF